MYLISKLLLIKIPCWFPRTSGLLEYLFSSLGCWKSVSSRGDRSRCRGPRSTFPIPSPNSILPTVWSAAPSGHLWKGTCFLPKVGGLLTPCRGLREPPDPEFSWVIPKPYPTHRETPVLCWRRWGPPASPLVFPHGGGGKHGTSGSSLPFTSV